MTEHEAVAEAAVVGFPHPVKGEGVYAYVTLKEGTQVAYSVLTKQLNALIKSKISGQLQGI